MSRKGRPSENRPPRGRGLHPGVPGGEPTPDLIRNVRRCLRSSEPLDLIVMASGILTTGIDPEVFLPSMLGPDLPETTALLIAFHELAGDLPGFEGIAPELERRDHSLPHWLEPIGLRVEHTAEVIEDLGDGEDVILGFATGSGSRFTIVLYVDHTMGTIVKDAKIVAVPIAVVQGDMSVHLAATPGMTVADLDPAEARARLAQAMENTDRFHPDRESDMWPMCRPIVEWALRQLPPGGRGYERRTWTYEELEETARRFLDSTHGAGLDDFARQMLGSAFSLSLDAGAGDPLRWSPVLVEVALTRFFPTLNLVEPRELAAVPALLRALVPFAHAERGVDPADTAATLAAIDRWEPGYRQAVAAMDTHENWLFRMGHAGLSELVEDFGGPKGLNALDEAPLPDEELDWTGIPADIRDRVAEILAGADGFCDDHLTVEHRTVCRRLLARAARHNPSFFRMGKAPIAAAALCWVMGTTNGVFGYARNPEKRMLIKTMLTWFGITKSVSARGDTLVEAAGLDIDRFVERATLGDPGLLVSRARAELIERREDYLTMLAGEDPWVRGIGDPR